MISSPLMDGEYDRLVPDYEEYRTRKIINPEQSKHHIHGKVEES